jgi:DNA-directed RNA polymerase subunit M/transcription elongation factor TFIIS
MKRLRKQKKAEMMGKAEELIDRLLDWDEQNQRPTMTQIEDIILQLRKEMGEDMAKAVLSEQEQKTPVPGTKCPKCGREMAYKGQHPKQVQTRLGEVGMERGYYTCPDCGEGIFPPGSTT